MVFSSTVFLFIFLPAVIAAYFLVRAELRNVLLLAANSPVTIEIDADGASVGTAVADLYREDLARAQIGTGWHCFILPTPRSVKDGRAHTIGAKIKGGQELHLSPKTFGP